MLARRIIPCLDVADGRVVKGVHFASLRDAGDPVEQAAPLRCRGADELVFLDISASHEARQTTLEMVGRVAESIFIPFTVGGGIRAVADAGAALRARARTRSSVNTAAVRDPSLVSRLAESFGSQCVVAAVDVKRIGGRLAVMVNGGREETPLEAIDWIRRLEALGAGEILLTSMDRDGTGEGYDLPAARGGVGGGLDSGDRFGRRRPPGAPGRGVRGRRPRRARGHDLPFSGLLASRGARLPPRARLPGAPVIGPSPCSPRRPLCSRPGAEPAPTRSTRAGTQVQGDVRVCPGRYRIADPSERGVLVAAPSGTRIDLSGVTIESGDSVPARYVGIGSPSRGVDGVTVLGGVDPRLPLRRAARRRSQPPAERHRRLRQPAAGSALDGRAPRHA